MSDNHRMVDTRPIVYLNFVYIYAGGARSTVHLVRELHKLTNVRVIDIYGQCDAYLTNLCESGVTPLILLPNWMRETTIGGQNQFHRFGRMIAAVPGLLLIVARLRQTLRELQPRAVWVDNEKSLLVSWMAAPPTLPIIYFVRGELNRFAPYCRLAWRRVNAAVGVSNDSLRGLRSTPYARDNTHVVYDGIDVDKTLALAERAPDNLPASDDHSLRVVLPAVITNPLKGHEVAIRAIAQFIAEGGLADLWLCGDVPREVSRTFYNQLQQLVHDLGIREHIHFLGWREDVPAVMRRADVVLLPSFTEGLPRSLLEAMALAKPVIATRVGGIPELVRDGIDGLLIDSGSVDGCVHALQQLVDPVIRAQMGASGLHRICSSFSLEGYAQRFLSVVDTLAAYSEIEVVDHRA